MQETNIGWCDFSSNLLRYIDHAGNLVHACVRVSEGCRNCYAATLAGRFGRQGKDFTAENMKPLRPFFDVDGAQKLLRSKNISGKKVFINDMTDLFGEWVSDEIIDQHFAVFSIRPDVVFQILSKRAKRMKEYLADPYHMNRVLDRVWQMDRQWALHEGAASWPLPNVHLGVSVEDQKNADARLPFLLQTPAAIRWVSVEPLIGDVELGDPPPSLDRPSYFYGYQNFRPSDKHDIDGIVIGGESGSGHREMPLDSAVRLARYAHNAGVSVFVKQDSGPRPGMQGRIPDDVWALKKWPA